MPYNWRRSSHSTSSESPIMRLPSRSSDSSESESPASVDYSHLQIQPVAFKAKAENLKTKCTGCDLPFDEAIEARQPRLLPCLHSFCTQCLLKAYDYLEIIAQNSLKRRPSSRYSWRSRQQSPSRSSSPSRNLNILGHFLCPVCLNGAPMVVGGRDSIKNGFPLDPLALVTSESTNGNNKSLLNFVVQEIQPKIKVIQSAILESENARKIISENVALIEKRLMPNIPSESETITRVRTELLESLHKSRAKRLNAIVKRQIILKQCEKDMRFLYTILQKLNTLQEGNAVNQQIFPLLARRLSDLGNLLEQVSVENSATSEDANSIEKLEHEVIANGIPQKALAELTNPLYEKVICNIPFLVLDSSKKLVSQNNLDKISGGLTFQKDETVEGKLSSDTKNYGGLSMEVIPSKSGLAEIDLKYEDKVIQVRPSTAFIRPLSLDPIRKSPRNSKVQLVNV